MLKLGYCQHGNTSEQKRLRHGDGERIMKKVWQCEKSSNSQRQVFNTQSLMKSNASAPIPTLF